MWEKAMIKENQRLLNQFNVITDGVSVLFTLLLAFWVRFFLLPGGEISVPFSHYVYLGLALVPIHLFTYASFGLYESFRKKRLYQELGRLCTAKCWTWPFCRPFSSCSRRSTSPAGRWSFSSC